jgi:hypothetical protein
LEQISSHGTLVKRKKPSKQKEKAGYKNSSTRTTRDIKAQEHMS